MENVRLTFNDNKTYGWNVPLTLRSRQPMSVKVILKDGTELIYNNVIEYEHMWSHNWGAYQPINGCIEFENGEYVSHPLAEVQSVHVTETHF